jgi:hypothetical protein
VKSFLNSRWELILRGMFGKRRRSVLIVAGLQRTCQRDSLGKDASPATHLLGQPDHHLDIGKGQSFRLCRQAQRPIPPNDDAAIAVGRRAAYVTMIGGLAPDELIQAVEVASSVMRLQQPARVLSNLELYFAS